MPDIDQALLQLIDIVDLLDTLLHFSTYFVVSLVQICAAIIHAEVSSAAQLGHCCSSFLCCCSETLELSSTELSNCSIR